MPETGLGGVGEAHRLVFAEEPRDHVLVRFGNVGAVHVDGRHALVGRVEHLFRFGDHAEQGDRKDLLDVLDRQHFALFDALQRVAGQ